MPRTCGRWPTCSTRPATTSPGFTPTGPGNPLTTGATSCAPRLGCPTRRLSARAWRTTSSARSRVPGGTCPFTTASRTVISPRPSGRSRRRRATRCRTGRSPSRPRMTSITRSSSPGTRRTRPRRGRTSSGRPSGSASRTRFPTHGTLRATCPRTTSGRCSPRRNQLVLGRSEMPKVNGVAAPSNPGELGELLNDAKAYAKIYADPEAREDFHRKYAVEMFGKDPELKAQLDEQIQMGVQKQLAGTGATGKASFTAGGRPSVTMPDGRVVTAVSKGKGAVYNRAAPGAVLEDTVKEADRRSEEHTSELQSRRDL